MSKLQSIISMNPIDYISKNNVSYQQCKAINAISSCQTSNMGSHRLTCECGHEKIVHNSCYNRHCPICGNFKKEMWIQKQQESMIPGHYFHLVFTLPDTLRSLAYYNQKIIYDLMYSATSKTILDLSKDKLGIIPGFSLILHTWSQTLIFHPHLHCILAGGGLSLDQTHFKSFKKKFFLHVKVLSAIYKGKFMEGIKNMYADGDLVFPSDLEPLADSLNFKTFVDDLYNKDWVVFSKPAFKSPTHVIKYLGRYTHKVAIYDSRIISYDENFVTFSYLDRSNNNKRREMTLTRNEFIRRFLMHVLPHRFTKIRHYGFLSNRFRSSKISLIRTFIARQRGVIIPIMKALEKKELLEKLIGKERLCCPECGRFFSYNHGVCMT